MITQRLLFYNVVMFESTVWEGVLLKRKTLRYDKEIITQKWLFYNVVMFESTWWGMGIL